MSVYIDFLIDEFMEDNRELMDDLSEPSVLEPVSNSGGTVDANKYTASLKAIRDLLQDKNAKERLEAMGSVSVATSVPIIAVTALVGQMYEFTPELNIFLHRLMQFYRIGLVIIGEGRISHEL